MNQEKRILVIDDDFDILSAAKLILKRHFGHVEIEKNPQKIPYLLNQGEYDLILLDMNFSREENSGQEGFHWLDTILDKNKHQKVVLFTAYGDIEMAVRAIKLGASDFILKPWENQKLIETIQSILDVEVNTHSDVNPIIGTCEEMKRIFAMVDQVAPTDANILILGENGTGKDLLAKEIHKKSQRSENIFVHADLGAVNENLFESELFGHVKGAFTDARDTRIGKFEMAHKGTLFLDEIGNLPLTLQKKLLFAVQNRKIVRVGSNTEIPFDIRLICATNAIIYEFVENEKFRQDLLFRINTIEITLPPLRDRDGDILLLADHFLKIYAKKYKRKIKSISSALQKKLLRYAWPGNIRELQHVIERAVIISKEDHLLAEDFEIRTTKISSNLPITSYELDEVEKQLIIRTLKKYNGNITEASKEIGISRQALYRRIEKFNL